jgi:hypothetical protein
VLGLVLAFTYTKFLCGLKAEAVGARGCKFRSAAVSPSCTLRTHVACFFGVMLL